MARASLSGAPVSEFASALLADAAVAAVASGQPQPRTHPPHPGKDEL